MLHLNRQQSVVDMCDHCASPKITPGFMALLLTALVNKLLKGPLTQELYLSASQISSHKLYTLQPISGV